MALAVRYHVQFRQDVTDHAVWFDEQQSGLGDEFVDAVDLAIHALYVRPFSHRLIWKHYRRVLIRRFRVIIPFEIVGENLLVLGVVPGHGTCRAG